MSKVLESYCAHVLRNWDFIACPEEDWVCGNSLRTPEMSEDDTSDDEPSKEEGDEEDNAVEWFGMCQFHFQISTNHPKKVFWA